MWRGRTDEHVRCGRVGACAGAQAVKKSLGLLAFGMVMIAASIGLIEGWGRGLLTLGVEITVAGLVLSLLDYLAGPRR